MGPEFKEIISNEAGLREVIGYPSEMNVNKVISVLDEHCRNFIARSPYLLLASNDGNGNFDISPKGDPAGFVQVLDEKRLVIPDRIGNGRIDTLTNIVKNNQVALFFLVPGKRETLRVSGTAMIVRDIWLREQMSMKGKLPNFGIVVTVQRVFMHCAKSIIRSGLWKPEEWPDPGDLASLSRVLNDHANLNCDVDELEEAIITSYQKHLY